MEEPLLTTAIRLKRIELFQRLMNALKSALACELITFSDEKPWALETLRNIKNDCYLSLGDDDESAHGFSTTKLPASVLSLSFVASNCAVMPIMWFMTCYRVTGKDYRKT